MTLGPYASFIVASYALVGVVVLMLVTWIALDYRHQRTMLENLHKAGVVRRSGKNPMDVT